MVSVFQKIKMVCGQTLDLAAYSFDVALEAVSGAADLQD
jgi:hypothetical protein